MDKQTVYAVGGTVQASGALVLPMPICISGKEERPFLVSSLW